MLKESDILYQSGRHWVLKVGAGHFEIMEDQPRMGYSLRRGTVAYPNDPGKAWARAAQECDRLAAKAAA